MHVASYTLLYAEMEQIASKAQSQTHYLTNQCDISVLQAASVLRAVVTMFSYAGD